MHRRTALGLVGSASFGLLGGCLDSASLPDVLKREDAWRELVVDPPDGVYVPPKIDSMAHYGTATAGGYEIAVMATRPHSFWTVAGSERSRADVRSRHALHLMVDVRDAASGVLVPTTVRTTVRSRDEDVGRDTDANVNADTTAATAPVDERTLWPMLSQRMGVHYGDNAALGDDGSYDVTVHVGPPACRVTGDLADRLDRSATAEIAFEYDSAEIEDLERTLLDADEGRGERGAIAPMGMDDDSMVHGHGNGAGDERGGEHEHEHGHEHNQTSDSDTDDDLVNTQPVGDATLDALPGDPIGVATAADLAFPATVVDAPDVTDGDDPDPYLAVAPQTAFNGYRVPFASLSVVGRGRGETVFEEPLRETVDRVLGHHYGAAVDATDSVDELELVLESPPQLARHEGYETAFLEPARATLSVE